MPEPKNPDPESSKKKPGREEQSRNGHGNAQQAAQSPHGEPSQPSQSSGGRGPVSPRRRRYLIAQRPGAAGLQAMAAGLPQANLQQLQEELRSLGANIVKEIRPRTSGFSLFATDATRAAAATPGIVVAELDPEKGEELRMAASGHMIVEHDALLQPFDYAATAMLARSAAEAALSPVQPAPSVDVPVRVIGPDGEPVGKVTFCVYGHGLPAQCFSDDDGVATLRIPGGSPESVQALYVKPEANYWEKFILRPSLSEQGANVIQLRRLDETFPELHTTGVAGWGQRLMGLDQLARGLTGRGVKVAIIDSGCDNSHPQLQHVRQGIDLTTDEPDTASWTQDLISHGTHCAGIIGAAPGPDGAGIRGFAPEAEIHAFKLFPGGRFSALIEALDLCIEQGIDVVNLSLGSEEVSELVTRKILEAQSKGVACIVAAGNSSGPVQFPGNLPNVLTVGAIGKLGEYPDDTNHARTMDPGLPVNNGIFPASFSCFGPAIDVCAPGVAILSCVAGGGYAVWDGTSMAAPHITGLAALLLAHHPLFQGPLKARTAERVTALFQLIKASAVPLVADIQRGGAGLPTVQALLNLAVAAPAPTQQPSQPRPDERTHAARSIGSLDSMQGLYANRGGYGPGAYPGMQFTGIPQTGYGQLPYATAAMPQAPLVNPVLANPATLSLISQMRYAGLI